MEDHREKDKRVEEDAMRRFFSSQQTGFICPILNGPCSTMTEAEEIEAELHTRIKELEAQLTAAEARVKELEQGFREVLVCARNISEGYYEDAALLGRIARSFLVGRCTGAISHAVFVQRKLRKGGGCAKPTKQ